MKVFLVCGKCSKKLFQQRDLLLPNKISDIIRNKLQKSI